MGFSSDTELTMIDALDHICIVPGSAIINDHPVPEFWHCNDCGTGNAAEHKLRVTRPTAEKLNLIQENGTVLCPNCGDELVHSGAQHFAEMHVDVCVDHSIHTPERYRLGEITSEEYAAWFNSLTDREKVGQYERERPHHLTIRLSHQELELEKKDPEAFQQIVHDKLVARLELDAHYILQHRYQQKQRRADHLVKHFQKHPGGSLAKPVPKSK
jgi:predicted nucleic-acid-binding Zn-ribbon protein